MLLHQHQSSARQQQGNLRTFRKTQAKLPAVWPARSRRCSADLYHSSQDFWSLHDHDHTAPTGRPHRFCCRGERDNWQKAVCDPKRAFSLVVTHKIPLPHKLVTDACLGQIRSSCMPFGFRRETQERCKVAWGHKALDMSERLNSNNKNETAKGNWPTEWERLFLSILHNLKLRIRNLELKRSCVGYLGNLTTIYNVISRWQIPNN